MTIYKKILCPTDFSEASFAAIKQAVTLAGTEGEITVVHVDVPMCEASALIGLAPDPVGDVERCSEAVKNLCAVVEEYIPVHIRTRPILKQGSAAEEIVKLAREEKSELIVLTTHGACGWRTGELGAVAETILRKAPCPVLVVGVEAQQHKTEPVKKCCGMCNGLDKMKPAIQTIINPAMMRDGD